MLPVGIKKTEYQRIMTALGIDYRV